MVKSNKYYKQKLIELNNYLNKKKAKLNNNNDKIENMFDREKQIKTDETQCLDTVGAICLDSMGNFASAISSGGILLKVYINNLLTSASYIQLFYFTILIYFILASWSCRTCFNVRMWLLGRRT